jgi:hypothetical protein
MDSLTMWLPWMIGRQSVRIVSACLRDLPGVETLHADPATGMLVVCGSVTAEQVRAALPEARCQGVDDRSADCGGRSGGP